MSNIKGSLLVVFVAIVALAMLGALVNLSLDLISLIGALKQWFSMQDTGLLWWEMKAFFDVVIFYVLLWYFFLRPAERLIDDAIEEDAKLEERLKKLEDKDS